MPTKVKAHRRRGTRGVRRHWRTDLPMQVRLLKRGSPEWFREEHEGGPIGRAEMFVNPRRPFVVYIAEAEHMREEEVVPVLSHETLHAAVGIAGGGLASAKLDDPVNRRWANVPETSGLYAPMGRKRDDILRAEDYR
jgi:hypothetical protein